MRKCSFLSALYFFSPCCMFIAVRNDLNEFVLQQNQKLFIGRIFDWKQISGMLRLTWLSGVLFSWKMHTDRYRAEGELISSNCGLCCFTAPVRLQVSLSLSSSLSLGNCILINIKHTHTHTCCSILRNCTAQIRELASSWLVPSGLSSTESPLRGLSKVCMKSDGLTSDLASLLSDTGTC